MLNCLFLSSKNPDFEFLRTAGIYMQEALELVCKKRKLSDPNSYALLLPADKRNPAQFDRSTDQNLVVPPVDRSIVVPLDRTVASLQGKRELLLVKKSVLPQMNALVLKGVGRTTDPNSAFISFYAGGFVLVS
jgi:hypothetical protein